MYMKIAHGLAFTHIFCDLLCSFDLVPDNLVLYCVPVISP